MKEIRRQHRSEPDSLTIIAGRPWLSERKVALSQTYGLRPAVVVDFLLPGFDSGTGHRKHCGKGGSNRGTAVYEDLQILQRGLRMHCQLC
jgi:hypothetical protein